MTQHPDDKSATSIMTHTIMEPTETPEGNIATGLTVGVLARQIEGSVVGDETTLITGISSIEEAEAGDVVFAENDRFLEMAEKSRASAIVAPRDAVAHGKPLIKVENPRYAFAHILAIFKPKLRAPIGIHPTAVISEGCQIAKTASIGPKVVLGENVTVGDGSILQAGVTVGDNSSVGDGCILYANVTLYHGCHIGNRTILHSGAVIGADGFGYMRVGSESQKIPQIGGVQIGDDVEIGANSTIDRAKTGMTTIGDRTKIDNLVHVAHNCKIGSDCILVAQVGLAGSIQMGRGVLIAGQAGLKDHITVGDGAVVLAQAGVFGDLDARSMVSGYPARPHREKLRQEAALVRLPETQRRVNDLIAQVRELHAQNERLQSLLEGMSARLAKLSEHSS